MRDGVWTNGKTRITGKYRWVWHEQRFHIWLDSTDPVTGQQRHIVVGGDSPEWGKWKRVKEETEGQ